MALSLALIGVTSHASELNRTVWIKSEGDEFAKWKRFHMIGIRSKSLV